MANRFSIDTWRTALGLEHIDSLINLMKKLDIHTIAELTQYAIRIGLIDLDG